VALEKGDIERVDKSELEKKDSRKAYYRLSSSKGDLPASQIPIELGKQEDEDVDITADDVLTAMDN